jgi:Holliday junction resolvase RusA-like endonuclease
MIQLELTGAPTAWAAPRFYKNRAYDVKKDAKNAARWQIRSQYRDDPIFGPVFLDITFFMKIPKATSGIRKKEMLAHKILPVGKPDTTNLQKLIEDCLKGIVIGDDTQCTDIYSRKRYNENPGILIRIFNLNAYPTPRVFEDKLYADMH